QRPHRRAPAVGAARCRARRPRARAPQPGLPGHGRGAPGRPRGRPGPARAGHGGPARDAPAPLPDPRRRRRGHAAGQRLSFLERVCGPGGPVTPSSPVPGRPVSAADKGARHMRLRPLPLMGVALLVAAGVVLTACGSSSSSSTASTTPAASTNTTGAASTTPTTGQKTSTGGGAAAEGETKLALASDPSGAFKYDKSTLTAKAGKVEITFTNDSPVPHDVAIKGNGVTAAPTHQLSAPPPRHPEARDLPVLLPRSRPRAGRHDGYAHRHLGAAGRDAVQPSSARTRRGSFFAFRGPQLVRYVTRVPSIGARFGMASG